MSGAPLTVPAAEATQLVRIGRQSIFNGRGKVVGYELLFRGTSEDAADIPAQRDSDELESSPEDQATSHVISATFGDFGLDELGGGLPLFVNLTQAFLTGDLPMPFGPRGVVLEVLENIPVNDHLLACLEELKAQGYTLAVDDFAGEQERLPLLSYADVIKLDMMGLTQPLTDLVDLCREHAPEAALLAERVETQDVVDEASELGIDLFQGYHFERPQVLERVRISPSQIVCLRLMKTLAQPDCTADQIEAVLALDPGLSLRVLRTANSAGIAAARRIQSLRQAVVLLGPQQLTAWIILTLLGGVGKGRRDDLISILTRSHACEQMASVVGGDPSAAYTVGMISAAAQVLKVNPTQLATDSLVGPELADAVRNGTGVHGRILAAILSHEQGELPEDPLGLSPRDLSTCYLAGWAWAQQTVTILFG